MAEDEDCYVRISRRKPQRLTEQPRARVEESALQALREGLPPALDAATAPPRDANLPEAVPPALLAMVHEHFRHANRHWNRASPGRSPVRRLAQ
ncbi:hypothetical protein ACIPWY_39485 [Streptomyces sp. NPDC090032]|uniref:hypothetical protein n=1 Tax=unclassified Streptomyces TaxID=2593676 RepID=UPI003720D523